MVPMVVMVVAAAAVVVAVDIMVIVAHTNCLFNYCQTYFSDEFLPCCTSQQHQQSYSIVQQPLLLECKEHN